MSDGTLELFTIQWDQGERQFLPELTLVKDIKHTLNLVFNDVIDELPNW
jgi:hypothetical protein